MPLYPAWLKVIVGDGNRSSSLLKFPVHLRQTLHFGFMGHDAEVIGIDFDPLQLARFETLLMLGPLGFAIGRGCRRLP